VIAKVKPLEKVALMLVFVPFSISVGVMFWSPNLDLPSKSFPLNKKYSASITLVFPTPFSPFKNYTKVVHWNIKVFNATIITYLNI